PVTEPTTVTVRKISLAFAAADQVALPSTSETTFAGTSLDRDTPMTPHVHHCSNTCVHESTCRSQWPPRCRWRGCLRRVSGIEEHASGAIHDGVADLDGAPGGYSRTHEVKDRRAGGQCQRPRLLLGRHPSGDFLVVSLKDEALVFHARIDPAWA